MLRICDTVRNIQNGFLRHCRFLLHPKPETDELLSSWLMRIAYELNTDPATLVNLYIPEWRDILWMRDIDLSAGENLFKILSLKSGFDVETFRSLTLKSYEGCLAERITSRTRNIFIQPLGNFSRIKVKHGMRYCPLCLKSDKMPYFRKKWRLSFSTACVTHNCFLHDGCPSCGTSVTISRRYRYTVSPDCYKCGFFFKDAEPEYIEHDSYGLKAIKTLYDVMDTGIFRLGDGYAYSILFFPVLYQIIRIVSYWKMDKGFFDHETVLRDIGIPINKRKYNFIEDVPLKEQYLLFSGATRVFEDFPERLIKFCRVNNMGKTELTRDMRIKAPFWYKEVVDRFNKENRKVNIEEIKSAAEYLRKRGMTVNLMRISKILGACLEYRKRRDVKALLLKTFGVQKI